MFDWSIPSANHKRDVGQKIGVAQQMTAMDSQVTNEELDELFHIIAKLKANEVTPYFEEATLKLMWKELVVRHGDSIRLTNKGRKQIRLAISSDLTSEIPTNTINGRSSRLLKYFTPRSTPEPAQTL